ncbi:hypothetical protein JXA32_00915 [Candidatus Sumerlaeota bacterium]|nr:hypothetical protein [Candidatus Sumerlaeota bacterium]
MAKKFGGTLGWLIAISVSVLLCASGALFICYGLCVIYEDLPIIFGLLLVAAGVIGLFVVFFLSNWINRRIKYIVGGVICFACLLGGIIFININHTERSKKATPSPSPPAQTTAALQIQKTEQSSDDTPSTELSPDSRSIEPPKDSRLAWQTDFRAFIDGFDQEIRAGSVDMATNNNLEKRYVGKTARWQLVFRGLKDNNIEFDLKPYGILQKAFSSSRHVWISFYPAPSALIQWKTIKIGTTVDFEGNIENAKIMGLGEKNWGMVEMANIVVLSPQEGSNDNNQQESQKSDIVPEPTPVFESESQETAWQYDFRTFLEYYCAQIQSDNQIEETFLEKKVFWELPFIRSNFQQGPEIGFDLKCFEPTGYHNNGLPTVVSTFEYQHSFIKKRLGLNFITESSASSAWNATPAYSIVEFAGRINRVEIKNDETEKWGNIEVVVWDPVVTIGIVAPKDLSVLYKRKQKLIKALDLCGTCQKHEFNAPTMKETLGVLQALKNRLHAADPMSDSLFTALSLMSGRNLLTGIMENGFAPNGRIVLHPSKNASIHTIQSILDEEDDQEHDDENSIVWFEYDWCHFGVQSGLVTRIRGDARRYIQFEEAMVQERNTVHGSTWKTKIEKLMSKPRQTTPPFEDSTSRIDLKNTQ